jgi:transcription antitermination factor NusG
MWAIAITHPSCETKALTNIKRAGLTAYLPRIADRRFHRGRAVRRIVPLFPRYLFVPEESWRECRSAVGVSGILMSSGHPGRIANEVIEAIRERCDIHDVFVPFRKGQSVTVERGPFAGQLGIYEGMRGPERANVLFRLCRIVVPVENLAAV